ncbi:MAG: hypothetical protein QOE70_5912 [Chthoniobacter sp.]|jgi:hypothetical protein|nr:hypothetical protein [Chthoniobacter sp.]
MSLFTTCFAAANDEWERVAGEPFFIESREFTAIAIEDLTVEKRAMLGGIFINATMRLNISAATKAASGVVKGTIISARGVRVRTNDPADTDGDGTYWLACGSVQIKSPSL